MTLGSKVAMHAMLEMGARVDVMLAENKGLFSSSLVWPVFVSL